MRLSLMCGTEQFINIAFPVANMDTTLRLIQERGRLRKVFKPSDTFFFLNRNASRIDLPLKCVSALELLSRPELYGSNSKRQPFGSYHHAGMHQDATQCVQSWTAELVLAAIDLFGYSNRLRILALESKFSRVVKHENRAICCLEPISCCLKMPR